MDLIFDRSSLGLINAGQWSNMLIRHKFTIFESGSTTSIMLRTFTKYSILACADTSTGRMIDIRREDDRIGEIVNV